MHFRKTATLLALALCVAGTGCKQQAGGEATKAAKSGVVLAEVNGTTITDAEFYKEQENLPPYLKPMTETPEGKKEMLDTMVVRELIMQQAQKDGIDKSPAVAAKLEDLRKRVIVEAYLKKKVEESANVSDADLQAFYKKNEDKFKTGDQIRASHILVKSEQEAKEIERQRGRIENEARANFRALLAAAKGNKARVKEIAREQASFSSRREEICRDYAREDQHGYCASRITMAHVVALAAELHGPEKPTSGQPVKKKRPPRPKPALAEPFAPPQ